MCIHVISVPATQRSLLPGLLQSYVAVVLSVTCPDPSGNTVLSPGRL